MGDRQKIYFYHEGYYDPYYTYAVLEDFRTRDRRDDEPNYEPMRTPLILNWAAVVSLAICILFAAIQMLS